MSMINLENYSKKALTRHFFPRIIKEFENIDQSIIHGGIVMRFFRLPGWRELYESS